MKYRTPTRDIEVIRYRIMKGDAFRRFPFDGDATYEARYARINQELLDDLKNLAEQDFEAKYGIWMY